MEKLESFGGDTPLGRPGQPAELASIYVQLAADDASYSTGQIYARPAALANPENRKDMTMADDNSDRSQNAGLGSRSPTSPAPVDVEREPMPERTPETGSDKPEIPPARSGGGSAAREEPTEGDPIDNPVHHTGHIPPPVTANRE